MASLNKVILIGNLTADPELKQTQGGVSVCSFSIAVNRRYSKEQAQQQCDFINIVAWRERAEFVTRYFKKGSNIIICGSIQTRNYTTNTGEKRTAFEIVADEVSFGESKANADGKNDPTMPIPGTTAHIPSAYTGEASRFEEISNDESLPF